MRHRRRGRGGGVERRQRQHMADLGQGVRQLLEHRLGGAGAGGGHQQQAVGGVQPQHMRGALAEGAGQEAVDDLFLELGLLLASGLAALLRLDGLAARLQLVAHGATRHRLSLDGQLHDPVAGHGLDHRPVVFAARRHPTHGQRLGRPAGLEGQAKQLGFKGFDGRRRPLGGDSIGNEVLEQRHERDGICEKRDGMRGGILPCLSAATAAQPNAV